MAVDDPQTNNPDDEPRATINTGGGAYVRGNVDTGGGAFIGRDLVYKVVLPFALVLVIGVAFTLLAVSQGWLVFDRVQDVYNPYAEPQEPKMPAGFNIAVAPFGAGDATRADTGARTSRWLANQLDRHFTSEPVHQDLGDVTVWHNDLYDPPALRSPIDPPMQPIAQDDDAFHWRKHLSAEEWLDRLGADLLLYGQLVEDAEDGKTYLHLSFYYGNPVVHDLPDIALGHHPFGRPIPILYADNPVRAEDELEDNPHPVLRERTSTLVWLVRALSTLSNGRPAQALETLLAAERALRLASWEDPDISSVFYFYLGQTALQVPDLAVAQRAFQAVIEHEDGVPAMDVVLAKIGLANYHYLRAQLYLLDARARAGRQAGWCLPREEVNPSTPACFDVDLSTATQDAKTIPADQQEAMDALLLEAIGGYQAAIARLDELDEAGQDETIQDTKHVAQVMMATAQRLAGEGYLTAYEDVLEPLSLRERRNADRTLLAQAETEFMTSTDTYSQTLAIIDATAQPGLLAYARYGLGIVQVRQACIAGAYYGDFEQTQTALAAAQSSFASCTELSTADDAQAGRSFAAGLECLCENAARTFE